MDVFSDNRVICRWDTPQHVLVDDPDPEEGTEHIWPGQYFSPELGTPQGSIVSPILCNILLHQLDEFILSLKRDFDKGTRRKTNPLWRKLTRSGRKDIVHAENISSRLAIDPDYKRL